MTQTNVIFIGIAGKVVALDRSAGKELWRSDLKDSDFTNVVLQDGDLYATTKGEFFCLDPANGEIRWQNRLKGLGTGLISIATAGGQQTIVMGEKRKRDEDAKG